MYSFVVKENEFLAKTKYIYTQIRISSRFFENINFLINNFKQNTSW